MTASHMQRKKWKKKKKSPVSPIWANINMKNKVQLRSVLLLKSTIIELQHIESILETYGDRQKSFFFVFFFKFKSKSKIVN